MARRIKYLLAWVALLSASFASFGSSSEGSLSLSNYVIAWSDEFGESNDHLPDSSKWVIETGGKGWGNNELESYTDRPQNLQVENGNLVITAKKETYAGPDGITRQYTSARI